MEISFPWKSHSRKFGYSEEKRAGLFPGQEMAGKKKDPRKCPNSGHTQKSQNRSIGFGDQSLRTAV